MSKRQRRLVRSLLFPLIALGMMTSAMAIAGHNNRPAITQR